MNNDRIKMNTFPQYLLELYICKQKSVCMLKFCVFRLGLEELFYI